MRLPLQTGAGTVGLAPLAPVDLLTEEGVTASTCLFCHTPLALKPVARMRDKPMPSCGARPWRRWIWRHNLQRQFRLLGAKGVVGMALTGIDMVVWDTLARARSLALVLPLVLQPGGSVGRRWNDNAVRCDLVR